VAHTPDPESLVRAGQNVVVVPLAETAGLGLRDFAHTAALIAESRVVARRFLEGRLRLSA